jgi:hypothetical protein
MLRALSALAATLLVAAAPPPPAVLAPYMHDGRFDPGDYGWVRGLFDDAAPADKANWQAVMRWGRACTDASIAEERAQLVRMGIAKPALEHEWGALLCYQVRGGPFPRDRRRFADFQRAAIAARPFIDTYLFAAAKAEQAAAESGDATRTQLLSRPIGEQMLRFAWLWGEGDAAAAPPLAAEAKEILVSRLQIATAEQDHANTEWLKGVVDREGWPTISKVGADAAERAWILAQHADADPAFQLRVLRLMEPLVGKGEVSKPNYALLYDRVMLKLAGKQRYGTQTTCGNGTHVPLPLEEAGSVDRRRAEMTLPPMADYIAVMNQRYGACPADPAGRGSTKG